MILTVTMEANTVSTIQPKMIANATYYSCNYHLNTKEGLYNIAVEGDKNTIQLIIVYLIVEE